MYRHKSRWAKLVLSFLLVFALMPWGTSLEDTAHAADNNSIELSQTDTLVFYPKLPGYTGHFMDRSVTITNNGSDSITGLSVAISGADANSFELLIAPATILNPDASTSFSMRPKLGLAAAVYEATVTVLADEGVSKSFDVSFEVTGGPTYSVALSATNVTFATATEGYNSIAIQQQVNIMRTGTGNVTIQSVTLERSAESNFILNPVPSGIVLSDSSTSLPTLIRPKPGLTLGTYTDTVLITGANDIETSYTVSFTVNAPAKITSEPEDVTVNEGSDASFSVVATGTDLSYQWFEVIGTDYEPLTLETDATLVIPNVDPSMSGNRYLVVVTGLIGAPATSTIATLTVNPITVPTAPSNVTAVAGNRQATVAFDVPSDDGGSPITSYEVTASPGDIVAVGSGSPIIVTGLSNGTSYSFTVKAINNVGASEASADSNAVIPRAPFFNVPIVPANDKIDVFVNGNPESIGTAVTTERDGKTITTIAVDAKMLQERLETEGRDSVITIPAIFSSSDAVVVDLSGQMIKFMTGMDAVLEIVTDKAIYTLPVPQINIDRLAEQFGQSISLQDLMIQIKIGAPTADAVQLAVDAASKGSFTLVAPPIEFTITASYGEATLDVTSFNSYVARAIVLPDDADPNQITTGVVIDPDGTVRHVPTKVVQINEQYFAVINSLTNSTYAVVWNPLEFSDVADHWSQNIVNEMGSRMVIEGIGNGLFNPDQHITRAEFTAVIVRALGLKPENSATLFSDVLASDQHSSAIHTAYSYQLINGFEDGTFRPNDKITREQAMVVIAKAMAITNLTSTLTPAEAIEVLSPFTDAEHVASWALSGVAENVQAGIILGRNGAILAPKAFITRAEVAALMQRLLEKSNLI